MIKNAKTPKNKANSVVVSIVFLKLEMMVVASVIDFTFKYIQSSLSTNF